MNGSGRTSSRIRRNERTTDTLEALVEQFDRETQQPPLLPDVEAARQKLDNIHARNQAGLETLARMRSLHDAKLAELAANEVRRAREHEEAMSARTDVERAAASVRNVSTQPPRNPDFKPAEWLHKSERSWQNYLKSVGAA